MLLSGSCPGTRPRGQRGDTAWVGGEAFPQLRESTRNTPVPANPGKAAAELHRDSYSCTYVRVVLIHLAIFHIYFHSN